MLQALKQFKPAWYMAALKPTLSIRYGKEQLVQAAQDVVAHHEAIHSIRFMMSDGVDDPDTKGQIDAVYVLFA